MQTVQTSTTSTVALPPLSDGTVSVSGMLPTANVAATLTETITPTQPSGTATFSSVARGPAAARRTASASSAPIVFVEFAATQSVTLSGVPAFLFTVPSAVAGDDYELALYAQATDGSWNDFFDGPATVSGTTVSFAAAPGTLAIAAGEPVVLALWDEGAATGPTPTPTPSSTATPTATPTPTAAPSATPTPTIAPTATPTPTPTPTPVPTPLADPTAVNFDLSSSPTPAPVSVSEPNYAGTFSAAIACTENPSGQSGTAVATLTGPTNGVTFFMVAPGDETGSCNLTITDSNNGSTVVPVTSSLANLGVFGTHRKQK